FQLGGDSILAVQLATRARAAGIAVDPRDVFAHQSPRALARAVTGRQTQNHPVTSPRYAPTGPFPATPVMEWLASLGGRADGFAQSVVCALPEGVSADALEAALQRVVDRHDALRIRRTGDGGFEVRETGRGWLDQVDLEREGADDDAGLERVIDEERRAARRRLDPERGELVRAVWLHGRGHHLLLLVVHHLAVDGVSWRTLLPDLATAYGGGPLAPVPVPWREWAHRLRETDASADTDWWRTALERPGGPVGTRALDPRRDVVARAGRLTTRLDAEATRPLLAGVPAGFRAKVPDVLLAALSTALHRWSGNPRGGPVLVDVEGHGRETDLDGLAELDLSRTVGWFTALHPLLLDARGDDAADLARAVKRVKERLRAVPHGGLTHGLLRSAGRIPAVHAPIAFNYLGRLDTVGSGPWQPLPGSLRGEADPAQPLGHALTVDAFIEQGPGGPCLRTEWTWPGEVLDSAAVTELADAWHTALTTLAAHRTGPPAATPSDFPLADVDQARIEELEAAHGELADLLPASPLQQGLLFHAGHDAEDPYVVRLALDLDGDVDAERLREAAHELLRRHPHLGGGFTGDSAERPLYVVPAAPRLLFTSTRDADDEVPVDPARPPLLRFTLVRTGPRTSRLLFTHHHVLLDGWSVPLLLAELFALYRGEQLPPAPALRPYARWLAGRDTAGEPAGVR
ncbi:condensation domain-containing protein, partial [Streptomyces niveiscabiei]|uniref:condensation domain-containing protein n=1 Tax=Streptomyces niveiscabiei TaxID=164115 RepID=UPI000A54EE3B